MRAFLLVAAGLLLGSGCAHHKADQYAFAPPYAPPVYPQPASPQPVVAGVPAVPGTAPAIAPAVVAGQPMAGAPCQPVAMHDSPCPQGEYIVPGSLVGGEVPCTPEP